MDFIPVSSPSLSEADAQAVMECVRAGWISSEGPQVAQFEDAFASIVGKRHAIAVANGTAALDIAIASLGIGPGDEVILPSFTIISCLNQILRCGATPVFVDALPTTWNMDPAAIESLLTPRTKAIIVAHIYGLPADIDEILLLAQGHNIAVIEDSAEAHGQHLFGEPLGSFGEISTFSFYPNKLITTGEGGMVLTDNDELADKARSLRNLCFNATQRFVHHEIGWNYRMTAIQAALGLSQLSRMEELLRYKIEVGQHYQDLLSGVEGVALPATAHRGSENVYWVFGVVLNSDLNITAVEAMDALSKLGVGTRPFFYPLHLQPVLDKFGVTVQNELPIAEWLGKQGFYLPNGANLSASQREYVVGALKEIIT